MLEQRTLQREKRLEEFAEQERQRDLKAKEAREKEEQRLAEEAKKHEKPKAVSKQESVVSTQGQDQEAENEAAVLSDD